MGAYGDECVQGFRNGSWDTEGCLGGKCESFFGCPAHEVVGLGLPGLNYWHAQPQLSDTVRPRDRSAPYNNLSHGQGILASFLMQYVAKLLLTIAIAESHSVMQ